MNWLDPFFLTVGSTAVIILVVGLLLKRFPPAKINPYYGYRTPSSMRSQERWHFAQRYSASVMIRMGATVTPFAILGLFVSWPPVTSMIVALAVVGAMVAILLVGTERAIRHRFEA